MSTDRPGIPLTNLLVKPAGPDCPLACRYCFYRSRSSLFAPGVPHRMSDPVLEATVRQMMAQGEPAVTFTWQGGEPTLMGIPFYQRAVTLQERHGRGSLVGNGMQTNGLAIDAAWADFLHRYRFLVGLSIDGPRRVHDRYRTGPDGGGTFDRVRDAARRLLDRGVAVNALAVVTDYSAEFPEEIYGFFRDLGLAHMQFIPCYEVHESPSGLRPAPDAVSPAAWGRFLCAVYDRWRADFRDGAPTTSIRFFESLLFSYAGLAPPDCSLMEECGAYLVVEHTGDVYPCDFYVEAGRRLGNVMTHDLRDLLNAEAQRAFGRAKMDVPLDCADCPWSNRCQGGCPKDRQRGDGDLGINYFCESYRRFFAHADADLRTLAARLRRSVPQR